MTHPTEAGERERLREKLLRYAQAYSAYNRSEGGMDETRRLERLEDELVANLLRTEPGGEPVAWKVQHRNYVELWTDRRKANAFQQVENLRETYPDDEVTLTPLYLRPAAPVEEREPSQGEDNE